MALGSTFAKNADLGASYGDNHSAAAGWPATVYVSLWNGNPLSGGAELATTGGYARLGVTNTTANMGTPASGILTNAVAFTLPTSTGAYSSSANYFAYMDASTGGNILDCGPLSAAVTVTAANQAVQFPAGSITITAA